MKNIKKLITSLGTVAFVLYTAVANVYAQTPIFNNKEAQNVAKQLIEPLTEFALWAIPALALLALLISGLTWLTKDEDERENKPYSKIAKKIIIVGVAMEMMPLILKIFGL